MKFRTISVLVVISSSVLFEFGKAGEVPLKQVQTFLKENVQNNPELNHLPATGPNFVAQSTTFVGQPIVVQNEVKVLDHSSGQATTAADYGVASEKSDVADTKSIDILKEFSFGAVPGNTGVNIQYSVHGAEPPSAFGGRDAEESSRGNSFQRHPPITEFINQHSSGDETYAIRDNGFQHNGQLGGEYAQPSIQQNQQISINQLQNNQYTQTDSSQQNGGYDQQQFQQNGNYNQQQSGSYNQDAKQQQGGGYNQNRQQQQGDYNQNQQQQQHGGYNQNQQQQQQGGYSQNIQQQQQGGYNPNIQQQHLGGYNQNEQQQQGGYNQNEQQQQGGYSQNIQQQQGGYNQNSQQQQQGGYNQNEQQQQQGGYNQQQQQQGGYNQNQQQQQQQGGYNQNQQQSGGYSQNIQQQQGGYNQNEPLQQQQPNGGYNVHQQQKLGAEYGQATIQQAHAHTIEEVNKRDPQKLVQNLGLAPILQQADLVFQSEKLAPSTQNRVVVAQSVSQKQTLDTGSSRNQYGAPSEPAPTSQMIKNGWVIMKPNHARSHFAKGGDNKDNPWTALVASSANRQNSPVITSDNTNEETKDYQVDNLVIDKSGLSQTYTSDKAAKVIIHAQNVIIKSDVAFDDKSNRGNVNDVNQYGGQRDITPILRQQLKEHLHHLSKQIVQDNAITLGKQAGLDSSTSAKTNAFIATPNYFKPQNNQQSQNANQAGKGGYNLLTSVLQASALSNNNGQVFNNGQLLDNVLVPLIPVVPVPFSPPNDYGAGLQPPLPYIAQNGVNVAVGPPFPPNDYNAGLSAPPQNRLPPNDYNAGLSVPPPQSGIQFAASNTANIAAGARLPPNDYNAGLSAPPQIPPTDYNAGLIAPAVTAASQGRPNFVPSNYQGGAYAPPPNFNNGGGKRPSGPNRFREPLSFPSIQSNVRIVGPNGFQKGGPPRFKSGGDLGATRDYGSGVAYSSSDNGKLQQQGEKQQPFKYSYKAPPLFEIVEEGGREIGQQNLFAGNVGKLRQGERQSLFKSSNKAPPLIEITEEGPRSRKPTSLFETENFHPFAHLAQHPRSNSSRGSSSSKIKYRYRTKNPYSSLSQLESHVSPTAIFEGPAVDITSFGSGGKQKNKYNGKSRPNYSSSGPSSGYTINLSDPYTRLGKDLFYQVYDMIKKNTPSFQTIASIPRAITSTMNKIKIPPVRLEFFKTDE